MTEINKAHVQALLDALKSANESDRIDAEYAIAEAAPNVAQAYVEQCDVVERMETIYKNHLKLFAERGIDNKAMQQREARLVEALQFYADEDIYGGYDWEEYIEGEIDADHGSKAREALAAVK